MAQDTVPTPLVPVPDEGAASKIAADLAAEGVLLIELYGGFSSDGIEQVIAAVDGLAAIGVGSFALDAVVVA